MVNVFQYFGIQDVEALANRVLSADQAGTTARATTCSDTATELRRIAGDLYAVAAQLEGSWEGAAGSSAVAHVRHAALERDQQGQQLEASASQFRDVAAAIGQVQATARRLVAESESLSRALDGALGRVDDLLNTLSPVTGVVNWGVEQLTGVDVQEEANKLLVSLTGPIFDNALGLVRQMTEAITAYERVLRTAAAALRAMRGIVREDAGPVDLPGDADLRRGALFYSVYGRYPTSANDRLMAEALDAQGSDAANVDPNANVVVMHITPVPGAGVIQGNAFISDPSVFNVDPSNPFDPYDPDRGDDRGFDPNAAPDDSRVSYFIDYETGVVVVRQNATHSVDGTSAVGSPDVGVEQSPDGSVRIHLEATNPLAPPGSDVGHVSVRGDLVVDPHGGYGPAEVNGAVTRFPSWEVYQHRDGEAPTALLQRREEAQPGGTGPLIGLPQPTIPVGSDPARLDEWRATYHPDQGHGLTDPLEFLTTRGDDFFKYPVPSVHYPTVNPDGTLGVPDAHRVR